MTNKKMACLALVLALPGCATVIKGGSQNVTVSTDPAGASCTLDRDGNRVGAVGQTPGSVRVDRSRRDLMLTCSKPGYQDAKVTQSPSFNGVTFGNLIAGGIIGIAVDASTGANFSLDEDIRIKMEPVAGPAAPVAAPAGAPIVLKPMS